MCHYLTLQGYPAARVSRVAGDSGCNPPPPSRRGRLRSSTHAQLLFAAVQSLLTTSIVKHRSAAVSGLIRMLRAPAWACLTLSGLPPEARRLFTAVQRGGDYASSLSPLVSIAQFVWQLYKERQWVPLVVVPVAGRWECPHCPQGQ